MSELTLTPMTATLVFVLAVLAGYRYRRVWKAAGPRWQLWLWGVAAALCLAVVSFIPLEVG